MLRLLLISIVAFGSIASAAERRFDFSDVPLDEIPPGFRSALSGTGTPGVWKVVLDEAPALIPALTPNAPAQPKRKVLAQLSGDITDERFPLLIFDEESYGDFTFSTRLKMVGGAIEQMAGIAFRLQDERNYYYVRASALGNTFRFFKIVNGQRSQPIGPEIEIPRGVWHDLSIQCEGNQIRILFNDKQIIPTLTDDSFSSGKIAFWTKSDSISHFVDAKITYKPREGLATKLVRDIQSKYPRIVGIRIFTLPSGQQLPELVATTDDERLGRRGNAVERDVIEHDSIYYGKKDGVATVTMPLHDRNGDTIAAVQLKLRSFKGQTEQNAIARATPIVKEMEVRIRASQRGLE